MSERRAVRRDELPVRYGGADGGPTVLWVHGYSMSGGVWNPLWNRWPEVRHVAVDLPGHGVATPWPRTWGLPEVGAALADVAEAEGAQLLVAMSFGSSVALQALMDRPAFVPRAALAAATIAEVVTDADAARRMRILAGARRVGADGSALADLWMAAPPDIFTGLNAHSEAREHMRSVVRDHSFVELLDGSMNRAFAAQHTDADLRSIVAELTVLVGEHDMPRFVAGARRLEATVPRCRRVLVPGSGHLPLQEVPDLCLPLLRGLVAPGAALPVPRTVPA